MKRYIFEEYRDKAGVGGEKLFSGHDEAVEYAAKEWDRMNSHDKSSYINDPCGIFRVYEVILTEEELEDCQDLYGMHSFSEYWTADTWSAL